MHLALSKRELVEVLDLSCLSVNFFIFNEYQVQVCCCIGQYHHNDFSVKKGSMDPLLNPPVYKSGKTEYNSYIT